MQTDDNKISTLMSLIKSFGYSACVVFVIFGTYIFSIKSDSKFVVPYILCSCFYAFVVIYYLISTLVIPVMTRDIQEKKDSIKVKIALNDIYCLFLTWFFWITYGVIFKDVSGAFGSVWNYIQTFILVFFMTLSYLPCVMKNKIYIWSIIVIYSVLVVFFFSKDGISYNSSSFVLMFKCFLFCISYIVNDYELQIPSNIIEMINASLSKKLGTKEQIIDDLEYGLGLEDASNLNGVKEQILRMRAISLIRSYWILTCPDRIVPFSPFQILPILIYRYSKCANMGKKYDTQTKEIKDVKPKEVKTSPNIIQKKTRQQDAQIRSSQNEDDSNEEREQADKQQKKAKKAKKQKEKKTIRQDIPQELINVLRNMKNQQQQQNG